MSVVTDLAKEKAGDFLRDYAIEKGHCWFYGSTGNHICNQIANGNHGKLHFCALLQEVTGSFLCDPITDPNCVSPQPTATDIANAVAISRYTTLFGTGDFLTVQEAAKKALELTIEVELDNFTHVSFMKEAVTCVHDYAKELSEDINKCDDNNQLFNLYGSLAHHARVDDLPGCIKNCNGADIDICNL